MTTANILIVDDSTEICFTLKQFLIHRNYHVDTATDYQAANKLIANNNYEIILLDIVLPVESGLQLLEEVKKNSQDTYVIMITGSASMSDVVDSFRRQADDVLLKPISYDNLLSTVNRFLRERSLILEKKYEKQLREKYQTQMETILTSLKDEIITIDNKGYVTYVNQAFADACHTEIHLLIEQNILDLEETCANVCLSVFLQSLSENQYLNNVQITCEHDDKKERVLILNTLPLTNNEQNFGTVLLIKDLTRLIQLETILHDRTHYHQLIGQSTIMQRLYSKIDDLKNSDESILLLGEPGTGKELTARILHNISSRKSTPFIKIESNSMTESQFETKFFGTRQTPSNSYKKNQTGLLETINKATIFIDELTILSADSQKKLFKLITTQEFTPMGSKEKIRTDVRIIAATSKRPAPLVRSRKLRQDLYYALKENFLIIPPLRDRIEDIPQLIFHHRNIFSKKSELLPFTLSKEVMECFIEYQWPNNIRELQKVLEHCFIINKGEEIQVSDLPSQFQQILDRKIADAIEQSLTPESIRKALIANRWNKSRTADMLKVSRTTLYNKIKEYNIS